LPDATGRIKKKSTEVTSESETEEINLESESALSVNSTLELTDEKPIIEVAPGPEIITPSADIKQKETSTNKTENPVKRKTVSIKNFVPDKKAEQQTLEAIYVENSHPFTLDDLSRQWQLYSEELEKNGKMNWLAMIKRNQPNINEEGVIEFALDHIGLEPEYLQLKVDFLSFLRTTLNNGKINLEVVVRQHNTEKNPVTGDEKFEFMSKKNPAILHLKNLFDLEPEI
jgi:DNA polymerase-3 subunit gamma/tau